MKESGGDGCGRENKRKAKEETEGYQRDDKLW